MDHPRLRPRGRKVFSGFTKTEVERLEKLFEEMGDQALSHEFCLRTARTFSRCAGRAGKPVVKWNEIHDWFQHKQQECQSRGDRPTSSQKEIPLPDVSRSFANQDMCAQTGANEHLDVDTQRIANKHPEGVLEKGDQDHNHCKEKALDLSELEFEALSSKDGAWYDVEKFLTHRILSSGETEVLVRFVGFGAEEDEWVNVKKAVRERSVPLEPWECQTVKVGDVLLCLQEKRNQAIYHDAHVLEIQRRKHDIRGCRCLFLIQYDHDKSEEKVWLRRLCRQP